MLLFFQLHAMRREVGSSAQNLENKRLQLKQTRQQISNMQTMCVKFEEDINRLKQKLAEMEGSSMNSAQKMHDIEAMIEAEENMYAIYVSDTEKLNTTLFRCDSFFKEQVAIGKSMEVELNNTTLFCAQLRKHIRSQKKELEKVKEVVYNMVSRGSFLFPPTGWCVL